MLFVLKLILAPLLLGIASLAGRIWGSSVSGLLIALPIISGPIILIITLEHGIEFAIIAANGCLLGIIAIIMFCLTYSHLSTRYDVCKSLSISILVIFLSIVILEKIKPSPLSGFIFVIICLISGFNLLPKNQSNLESRPPNWEIVLRMLAACLLVITVTQLANRFGPHLSGIMSSFPIASLVLITFTHHFHGADSTIKTIRGIFMGLFSFAIFFLVLSIGLNHLSLIATYSLATAICLCFHGIFLILKRKII